jgi:hypothetical protein
VVNVIKFMSTFNFLPPATFAVMDTFLSGYKRIDRDNEVGLSKDSEASSCRGAVCKEPKCRKCDTKCLLDSQNNICYIKITAFIIHIWLQNCQM